MDNELVIQKEKLFKELKSFLNRLNNLETINLDELLLQSGKQTLSKNEFVACLQRLINRFGDDFHKALNQLDIDDPVWEIRQRDLARIRDKEDKIKRAEAKRKAKTNKIEIPIGFEKWDLKNFEDANGKPVAYWSPSGAYGTSEIYTHNKIREFCFKPSKGDLIILSQGHKLRLSTKAQRYYFKITKRVL